MNYSIEQPDIRTLLVIGELRDVEASYRFDDDILYP
jgi:hypothetical protein